RHPVALVRISVPPDQVDVNVHPTKAEVRFRHERLVYATVAAAVRDALADSPVPDAPMLAPPPFVRSERVEGRAGEFSLLDDGSTPEDPLSFVDPVGAPRERSEHGQNA